jgi:hypothetical protein
VTPYMAEAEQTILGRATDGLEAATRWIAGHATDGDGHRDAIKGIELSFWVWRTLEQIYGPSMVDEIVARAQQVVTRRGVEGVAR